MPERARLLLATGNAGKVAEFRKLLAGLDVELFSLADFPAMPEVAETGDSYLDNARIKAIAAAQHSGIAALADDSGIEVDALEGGPGVRSARFAADADRGSGDAANIALLLERMREVVENLRGARFRCVIVVAAANGRELIGSGTCEGWITRQPRGQNGFGYDPVFFHPASQATFAELSPSRKHAISHRARACDSLRRDLPAFLRPPTEDL